MENLKKIIHPNFILKSDGSFNAGIPENLKRRMPLYGLASVVDKTQPIYIVEGEKCVDALWSLGFQAVTSQGGSNAANKSRWEPLAGANCVYLLPDNDAGGKTYIENVAALLQELQISPKQVFQVALPDLTEKQDVVDWLKKFPELEKWDEMNSLQDYSCREHIYSMFIGTTLSHAVPAKIAKHANQEIVPLRQEPSPEVRFPVEALGEVLAGAALAIHEKIQAPLAICAQSVLASATLVVQGRVDIILPMGQTRPISNFFLSVAASGERKSSCDNSALSPIKQYESELTEKYQIEYKQWKSDYKIWESIRKKSLHITKNIKQSDISRLREEQKGKLDKLGVEPEEPLIPIVICPDPTIEGLHLVLRDGQPSAGIFSGEGGQFVGGHAMNKDDRLKTVATLSTMWDGEDVKRVRRADGVDILVGRRVSLHLMMQPQISQEFLSDETLNDQGFISRFLVVSPTSTAGTRFQKESISPKAEESLEYYNQHLLNILRLPLPIKEGSKNSLCPRQLPLADDAIPLWRYFADECEKNLGADGEWESIRPLANKLAEHATRTA